MRLIALALAALTVVQQPSAPLPALTGTVVVVNQQSVTVTLVDLKTLE